MGTICTIFVQRVIVEPLVMAEVIAGLVSSGGNPLMSTGFDI